MTTPTPAGGPPVEAVAKYLHDLRCLEFHLSLAGKLHTWELCTDKAAWMEDATAILALFTASLAAAQARGREEVPSDAFMDSIEDTLNAYDSAQINRVDLVTAILRARRESANG